MRILLACLLLASPALAGDWEELQPGLDLGVFDSPQKSDKGDSKIRVVRVDPERFELVLVMASAQKEPTTKTARQWSADKGLLAAINASMYATDHKSSVSLMRAPGHVNNPRLTKDMDILAFGAKKDDIAPVRIVDRGCDDHGAALKDYGTAVQSIRMLSCEGKNVWSQQPRKWSHAVIGIDGEGRPLLIHARSPWSTHDFVEILRALPIDLKRLQYAEGGPEAQLFVKAGGREVEEFGSFETGFFESDANKVAWPGVPEQAPEAGGDQDHRRVGDLVREPRDGAVAGRSAGDVRAPQGPDAGEARDAEQDRHAQGDEVGRGVPGDEVPRDDPLRGQPGWRRLQPAVADRGRAARGALKWAVPSTSRLRRCIPLTTTRCSPC